MLLKKDKIEADKASANLKRGGIQFLQWIHELMRACHWDTVNSDIRLMADDRIFSTWEKGMSVKEFVASKKGS